MNQPTIKKSVEDETFTITPEEADEIAQDLWPEEDDDFCWDPLEPVLTSAEPARIQIKGNAPWKRSVQYEEQVEVALHTLEFANRHQISDTVKEIFSLNRVEDALHNTVYDKDDFPPETELITRLLCSRMTEKIKQSETAWRVQCLLLYDKAVHLIANAITPAAYSEFVQELVANEQNELQFVPVDQRELQFCKEVLGLLRAVQDAEATLSTYNEDEDEFALMPGGILLYSSEDGMAIEDVINTEVLFTAPHIERLGNTWLLMFSYDEELWGLVDERGKILVPPRYFTMSRDRENITLMARTRP
jgi:hypothetical protein